MGGSPDDGQSLNEYRLLMRQVLYEKGLQEEFRICVRSSMYVRE